MNAILKRLSQRHVHWRTKANRLADTLPRLWLLTLYHDYLSCRESQAKYCVALKQKDYTMVACFRIKMLLYWSTKETRLVRVTAFFLLIMSIYTSMELYLHINLTRRFLLPVPPEHFVQNALALLRVEPWSQLCRKYKADGSCRHSKFWREHSSACISNKIRCPYVFIFWKS